IQAHHFAKARSKGRGGAEPAANRDIFDGLAAGFEQLLRTAHASDEQPLQWRRASLLTKATRERTRAGAGPSRERRDIERLVQVRIHPIQQRCETFRRLRRLMPNELRLTTIAV